MNVEVLELYHIMDHNGYIEFAYIILFLLMKWLPACLHLLEIKGVLNTIINGTHVGWLVLGFSWSFKTLHAGIAINWTRATPPTAQVGAYDLCQPRVPQVPVSPCR